MAPKYPKKTNHGYIYKEGNSIFYAITNGIQDPKSVTIEGKKGQLFTECPFDAETEVKALLERLGEKYPTLKKYLTGINLPEILYQTPDYDFSSQDGVDKIREYNATMTEVQNSFDFRQLIAPENRTPQIRRMLYGEMVKYFDLEPEERTELLQTKEFGKMAPELCEEMLCITNRVWSSFRAKIPMGADTSRNYEAIEDVAYLLGCPEMVVPSKRIAINKDGKTQFATFVEEAPGHKVFDAQENNIFLNKEHNPLTDPDALRLLSKMTVMDYITGSARYDWTDLTFQTDPENPGKIVNIVRNRPGDCFGGTLPTELPDVNSTFPRLEDIPVIPRSTANKVMALDKKKLLLSLSGKGLTKEQLNACWNRVEKLQEVLKQPVDAVSDHGILVVDDNRFGELNLKELYVKKATLDSGEALLSDRTTIGYRKNIFNRALDIRGEAKLAIAHRDNVVLKPYTSFEDPVNPVALKETDIHSFCQRLSAVDPALLKSSKEFAGMKAEMLKVDKLVKKMQTKQANNEEPSLNDLKKLSDGFREIQKWSSAYLKYKELTEVKGKYGKVRFEFAKQAHDFATQTKMKLNDRISQLQSHAPQNAQGELKSDNIVLSV